VRIGGMRPLIAVSLVGSVVLAACGAPGSGQVTPRSDGTVAPSPAKSPTASGTAPSATGTAAATAARPAFLSYAFTDVRDGKQFRLGDFQGKQVLVLGMAVW